METALIVSYYPKSISYLTDILIEASISNIVTATNAGEARRLIINNYYDLCIINTPLVDEFGESLATDIAANGNTEVILIVKSELFDDISLKVEDFGVITDSKTDKQIFLLECFWN